jgi:hypothetical protein
MRRWLPILLALAACGSTETPQAPEEAAAIGAVVARVLGTSIAPDRVVAHVGDRTITAADVAVYLDFFETLTTEQAVADLVDIEVARAANVTDPPIQLDVARLDARQRGRAYAYLRHTTWEGSGLDDVDPTELQKALDEPAYSVFYGIPELTRASHILVRNSLPEGAAKTPAAEAAMLEAARGEARQILDELRAGPQPVTLARLNEVFDQHNRDRATGAPLLHRDKGLVFPRRFSGEVRWDDGITSVIQPFADAAFEAPVGSLAGPVETEFGVHVILVEARYPAQQPPEAQRREAVRRFLLLRDRQIRLKDALAELTRQAGVTYHPDNIAKLSQGGLDRIKDETANRARPH